MTQRRTPDILDYWFSRGKIDGLARSAGVRWRSVCMLADIDGHATIDFGREGVRGSRSGLHPIKATADARIQLDRLKAKLGQIPFGILYRVVFQERDVEGLTDSEREAMSVLARMALAQLAAIWWPESSNWPPQGSFLQRDDEGTGERQVLERLVADPLTSPEWPPQGRSY